MNISVLEPIVPAWNHMVRILFKPFSFKKWLGLGFCAFLAQCGQQSSSGGNSFPNQGGGNDFEHVSSWIEANFGLFLVFVGLGILAIFCVALLITWLSSRGKFMLLDGVVHNRGAIKQPWTEFKTLANSFFFITVIIELLMLLCFLIIAGIGLLIALPDFNAETFTGYGIAAICVTAVLLFIYIFVCIVITFFMDMFLVPTMYIKRVRAVEGWKIAWATFYSGHKWSSLLLFFMIVLLSMGAGTVALFTCCICCIGIIPYVSSVVLLPITVFFICYVLMYIQQFGDSWVFFKGMCRFCNYSMQGLEEGCACPECGKL